MKRLYRNKRLQKLYGETGKQRVMGVLFLYPEMEFSLSDLSKKAGVAKANIGKILDYFSEKDVIEITKLSKIWRIKAKRQNSDFVSLKIAWNLLTIFQSGLVEYLNEYYRNPKSIILFGSFRLGEDISSSDVDIAIEKEDIKEYKIVKIKELKIFEDIIGRKMQIHLFNRNNVDINLFNNIANGFVLSGFLEVKP